MGAERRVIVIVRIPADREVVERAAVDLPGIYEQVIEQARSHGLRSHLRVFRPGETMDIDEWESEEARDRFAAEARPLLQRLREARGSGPSVSETWYADADSG